MTCRTAPTLQEPWKVKSRGAGRASLWMRGDWGLASPGPALLSVCVCACLLEACLSSYTAGIKRFINLSIKARFSPALFSALQQPICMRVPARDAILGPLGMAQPLPTPRGSRCLHWKLNIQVLPRRIWDPVLPVCVIWRCIELNLTV